MRVHIGTDHAGFQLKEYLKAQLAAEGFEVVDHGSATYDALDDYPDTCIPAAQAVVAEPGGTGHRQSVRKVTMGGKTGTAQTVQMDGKAVCRGEICRDHAWFVGFAPADEPQVAAAADVEHGGFGAAAAAPIVGEMLERWWLIENGESGAPKAEEIVIEEEQAESDY